MASGCGAPELGPGTGLHLASILGYRESGLQVASAEPLAGPPGGAAAQGVGGAGGG